MSDLAQQTGRRRRPSSRCLSVLWPQGVINNCSALWRGDLVVDRREPAVELALPLLGRVLEEVERLEGVEEEVAEVLLHVRLDDAPVAVVGDAPAVHDLADEVAQRVPLSHTRDSNAGLSECVQKLRFESCGSTGIVTSPL